MLELRCSSAPASDMETKHKKVTTSQSAEKTLNSFSVSSNHSLISLEVKRRQKENKDVILLFSVFVKTVFVFWEPKNININI